VKLLSSFFNKNLAKFILEFHNIALKRYHKWRPALTLIRGIVVKLFDKHEKRFQYLVFKTISFIRFERIIY
jgi:hypothetical protein